MFNKIQNKLVILFTLVLFLVLLGVLLVITKNVESELLDKLNSDFKKSQLTFDRIQKLGYERLVESSILISEEPQFKSNVALRYEQKKADLELVHNTVLVNLEFIANLVKADLFVVTDRDGVNLANFAEPNNYGDTLTYRQSIKRAVDGVDPELSPKFIDIWDYDNSLFQVVSVPCYFENSSKIMATLTLGSRISSYEADTLKKQTGFEVSFILGNKIVASTFSITEQLVLAEQIAAHSDWMKNVSESMASSDVFKIGISGEQYFSVMAPVGKGADGFYILSSSESKELALIKSIQSIIFISGSIALILSILVSVLLGRTFSKPVLALADGVKKINQGNYDISIPVTTKDEIGVLTQSFNEMVGGLKERFHLLRYVGSHTKEMIQQSESTDVKLGGERRELTVLFSDIRGFTAYSEKITPEEVINMLNQYLSVQADLVTKFSGSIDKFVGDEMVAIFQGQNHATRAIECALEIMKITSKLNVDASSPIGIGIGINSGQVVLGNMGSKERLDYTVIGANVNLGARLCSAARPGQVLVTYETLKGNLDYFKTNSLPPMNFKGFSQPIPIFEVLG